MFKQNICMLALLFISLVTQAQKHRTDANIVGDVTSNGKHIPFINITIKGTTIGTTTDETGHFQLIDMPEGKLTVIASGVGFKSKEKTITSKKDNTVEIKFALEEDNLLIDEVVVSASRQSQKRKEAPIFVSTITPKLFNTTQSISLGESLNYIPGLRLENNCQNCGFSQVRMNGLEGPYSQILINNRPIFSGLAGVYGLELIPSNIIEKVEVIRGGASSIHGSSSIGGTINIILKEPKRNTYQVSTNFGTTVVGSKGSNANANDFTVSANATLVSDDHKSGVSLFGFNRKRQMFDANNDSFSEIAPLENLTFGIRAFHRFGHRDKLSVDYFSIKEQRDGGNKQDYPLHERDIAEALTHDLNVIGLSYDRYFRTNDLLTVYGSGQFLDRDSYYGANQALDAYGNTKDRSYNFGAQYKLKFENASLVTGIENTRSNLLDKKLGYIDTKKPIINPTDNSVTYNHIPNTTVSDQTSSTTGVFSQYEMRVNKFKFGVGFRYENYRVEDLAKNNETKSGNVFIPRVNVMYDITKNLQARLNYSQGYRAPQIFDEDLHIETSGSRKVIIVNSPDLKQEGSHSFMASLNLNKLIGTTSTDILVEGFYTKLVDAFQNDIGEPDANGVVKYTRINADGGAVVKGVNLEVKLKPLKNFLFNSGFTFQTSEYENPQEDFNEKRFFRTPNVYGFFSFDWDFHKNLCFSSSATYTGEMLVPYFGTQNPSGELRTSTDFFDLSSKLSYKTEVGTAKIEFTSGIKNIFNAYQNDFDTGVDRDPAYIYGPTTPRTVYLGLKFGNILD